MKKGFTLIELLIVISIIGLLAAISIFGLQGARESSRDAKRKADIESIRSALELHRADCGQYPNTIPDPFVGNVGGCTGNNYMNDVPEDPLGGAYSYTSPTDTSYIICSTLEDPPSTTPDTSGCGTCQGGTCRYKKTNP